MSLASGLVIRHDVATIDYENYGKETKFNATTAIAEVGNTEFGGISAATAIDSRWGVHARHTLRHVETFMDGGGSADLRGTRWKGATWQGLGKVGVTQVIHFNDNFDNFANAIDIALVQTVAKSSTLRIAPLYNSWDEVGKVGSGASAANNRQDGNGNSRKTEAQNTSNSNRWYEVRWAGKNDINQVNTQAMGSPSNALLKCDFDHPTNTSFSIMGGNTAIDMEYGTMNGDSGSPIYIDKNGLDGQVSGVLSGGSGNEYGDSLVYVRTRPYKTWITDTIAANPDNRAVYIATIPDQVINLGDTLNVTETSTGTEQGPLTPSFSLVSSPTGMTIDSSTGVISWTPNATQAGNDYTITVRVTEDGVVANSKDKSFMVTVLGGNSTDFWSWSGNPTAWSARTVGGGGPYRLASTFPYLQGDTNNLIYQQITGTLPEWADVTVQMKAADFEQTWSKGGELEYGFRNVEPTVANAGDPFLFSGIANVPNYDGDPLADGLGNTGGNVDYFFTFETTAALVNPWFVVRKNVDGNRFAVDDIEISYVITDTDEDGLPDRQEESIGTDPVVADTDLDGVDDGDELTLGTDPLHTDSDLDGYSDGHEVNTISTDPLDPEAPGGPNPEAIGINFVSAAGPTLGANVSIPVNAYAGVADVAQKNWNQTSSLAQNTTSGSNTEITSPQSGVIVDSAGTATSLTLAYTMNNTWSADNEKLTPFGPLNSGYIDTSAGTPNAAITLSNIPYANYNVYVYFGNNNLSGVTGSITDDTTTYSFTTIPRVTTPGNFVRTTDTGGGNPSANYALFTEKSDSTCTITYQRGSTNGGIFAIQIVPITVLSPYEEWLDNHTLDPMENGLPEFDADFDGLNNLIEFALYSNPLEPDQKPMMLMEDQGTTFSMTYHKAKAASGYNVQVKWSDNLDQWFTDDVITTEEDELDDYYIYKATVPKDGSTARFMRIVITEP